MTDLPGAPGRIRTRDPLLRRHIRAVARRRWVWPDRLFSCTDTGWTWPGVAQHMSPLAPQLAPRSPANVHPGTPRCGPMSSGDSASLANCDTGSQARDYPRPKAATPTGTGLPGARPPRVRRPRSPPQVGRGPRGEVAAFTARHDEVTPGAGPLRAIPVRPQVALPALRALLAARPLTKTHQYTVTRHLAGFTMPRRWPPLSAHSQQPRGPVRYCRCGCGGLEGSQRR